MTAARILGLALLGLALLSGAPAGAYSVDSWSVSWTQQPDALGNPISIADDFDDGFFPGFPVYGELCGSVSPGDEAGGRLLIGDDPETGPGCDGIELISANVTGVGEMVARATYDWSVPAPNEFYGISLGNVEGNDFVSLVVTRGQVPILGDAVIVILTDENFSGVNAVEALPVLVAPADLVGFYPDVELELSLTANGLSLEPHGRVRFGNNASVDLNPNPLGGSDGLMNLLELHGASLVATPEPGTALLLTAGLAALALGRRGSTRSRC